MDPGAAGQSAPAGHAQAPAPGSWSEILTRRHPQSPLQASYTSPPPTLRLTGIIDESTHHLLSNALHRAAAIAGPDLCVDLTAVEFCDLAGLRTLTSHPATLAGLPGEAATLLHILGWDTTPGIALLDHPPPSPA